MGTAYVIGFSPLESISKGGTIDTQSSVLRVYCFEMAEMLSDCSNSIID